MKRILLTAVLFLSLFSLAFGQKFGVEPKTKVDKEYEWEYPDDNQKGLLFRLIAIGESGDFSYYVRINADKYVPIKAATGPTFGNFYFLENYRANTLPLFKREIIEGEEVFKPVTTVELGNAKNVIIGIYGDGTKNKVLAISPDSIPLGHYAIVNVSNVTYGIRVNKKAAKLASFDMVVREPRKKNKEGIGIELVDIYDITKEKPQSYASFNVDVAPNRRVIVYAFKPKYNLGGPDANQIKIEIHE